jgi:hypothetical protein
VNTKELKTSEMGRGAFADVPTRVARRDFVDWQEWHTAFFVTTDSKAVTVYAAPFEIKSGTGCRAPKRQPLIFCQP